MSNTNTLKAIQCLIGSNCIVSTPESFYVGPKGLISNGEIQQTLEDQDTKIKANTSNISNLLETIDSFNEDLVTIRVQLRNLDSDIKSELTFLKETDDAIYETLNGMSDDIGKNTLDILGHLEQLNLIDSAIPLQLNLTPSFTVLAQNLELGLYIIRFIDLDGTVKFLGSVYKYGTRASTIGILGIMSDGIIEERDDNIGVHNYKYISGLWLEM